MANDKKKGIDTNSNVYTIVYAAVIVIIVAFLLAFVSSSLKPIQNANVERDTKNQILTSLNITGLSGQAIDDKYAEIVQEKQTSDNLPYYEANVDGQVKYVIPMKGRGLWGGLWGFVSVNDDKSTVYGSYFSHESETAGLGARITERTFQERFNGKPLFAGNNGQVALTVVKSGSAKAEYEVDGITGATLTSKGVAAMVTEGLQKYIQFLSNKN